MGKINMGRVILGGLVAGVVINCFEAFLNLFLIGDQMAEVMKSFGKSAEFSTNQLLGFNVLGFALGILVAWLYAAMRPRFGMGPKTGTMAGLAVWAAFSVIPNAGFLMIDFYPSNLVMIALAVQLVELGLAGVVAGILYKEEAEPARQATAARA